MKFGNKNITPKLLLLLTLVISVISIVASRTIFFVEVDHSRVSEMRESVELTERWFKIVSNEKQLLGIETDANTNIINKNLLGDDYTPITTTLGSLESKELSTNPEFSALITKYLFEAGVDSNSIVGVTASGSFPSLAISTLASLQTIGAKVILITSIGASSYGANQPDATMMDIEGWLVGKGGLKYKSNIFSFGAEDDNGFGLTEEGIDLIYSAAERNGKVLFVPKDLLESINTKTQLLMEAKINCLINIGGNQASMGSCSHAVGIPNGLNFAYEFCNDDNRGIISRIAEEGIPFIHLLNIKDLAIKSGIPLDPGVNYGDASPIYKIKSVKKIPVIISLIIIVFLILSYKKYFGNKVKNV